MKLFFRLLVLAVLAMGCSGCEKTEPVPASGNIVKIGVIGPFSGSYAYMGDSALAGIKTIMTMTPLLNNGDKVELITANDMNTPDLTLQALEKLTLVDKVSAVLVLSQSSAVLGVVPIADRLKIPILATVASFPVLSAKSGFISQLCFDDAFQGMVGALLARDELLIDSAAVLSVSENPSSRMLAEHFTLKFKALGGQVNTSLDLSPTTNIDQESLSIIRDIGTELLYLPVGKEKFFDVLNGLNQIGWRPRILGSDGLKAALLAENKGDLDLEEVLLTDYFSPLMPLTRFGKKALAQYRSLYKEPPNGYSVMGGEGYALLLDALNRCAKKEDTHCLNQMIRNTSGFEGITGKITIKDGKATRPLVVNVIREGRMAFLVKIY